MIGRCDRCEDDGVDIIKIGDEQVCDFCIVEETDDGFFDDYEDDIDFDDEDDEDY